MKETQGELEEDEDQHLYHTMGRTRELRIESLGLPAVLPPPEEEEGREGRRSAPTEPAGSGEML